VEARKLRPCVLRRDHVHRAVAVLPAHELGRRGGGLAPGWSAAAKEADEDRGLVVTADGIVVALQNLPVRFAIDRAGLVGADGPTHAGSFDIAYLSCLPNMVIMAAADEARDEAGADGEGGGTWKASKEAGAVPAADAATAPAPAPVSAPATAPAPAAAAGADADASDSAKIRALRASYFEQKLSQPGGDGTAAGAAATAAASPTAPSAAEADSWGPRLC
jgi:hypothetical protein